MKTLLLSLFFLLALKAFSQSGNRPDISNTGGSYSIMETDSVKDKALCNVSVPTAFTPNGDGENDLLIVRGTKVTQVVLDIYNRWGEKVYEASGESLGWDGTYNGVQLNSEVFVYYLRATCPDKTKIEKKGTVTLIR